MPWLYGSGSRRASAPDRESSPSLQPSTSQATNFCCGFPKSWLPRGQGPASKSEGLGFCHQVVAPLRRCLSNDMYFKDHLLLDKCISCATTHAETAEWKCNEWIPRSFSMNASGYIASVRSMYHHGARRQTCLGRRGLRCGAVDLNPATDVLKHPVAKNVQDLRTLAFRSDLRDKSDLQLD